MADARPRRRNGRCRLRPERGQTSTSFRRLCERLELGLSAGFVHENLGWIDTLRGDVPAALTHLDAAEQRFRALGSRLGFVLRDRSERICSSSWDTEAALSIKDKPITLAINPGVVQRSDFEQFKEEPPIERAHNEPPLNVKVLINFAPQNSLSAALQPLDTGALVSILRNIAREPRINKFSIVAFNMQEQRVIYRQEVPSLREGHALRHPDSDFLKQITKGGDGMPAFKDKLKPEEIDDLIRFIRHEFQGSMTPPAEAAKPMKGMK